MKVRFKIVRILILTLLFLLDINILYCQSDKTPGEKFEGFIKKWLLLGPIPAVDSDSSITKQKEAFQNDPINFKENISFGKKVEIAKKEYIWTQYSSEENIVNLQEIYEDKDFAFAYAFKNIFSPRDTSVLIGIGSDDAVKVWLNGELLHSKWMGRGLKIDDEIIALNLNKGDNRLLLKIQDMEYGWGFAVRFIDHIDAAVKMSRMMINEILEKSSVPGLSIAVGKDGKILWQEGFGYADLEKKVPVSIYTKFRIGSVSKPFTAAAVGKLLDEGKLDLDAPVQKYVPSFPEKRWEFTTRQLGGHLAGIRHYRGAEFISNENYDSVLEGLEIFKNDTLLFEPGTKYNYSSYGWNLISAVVEGASGEDFLNYMNEKIFEPAGMENTTADFKLKIIPNRTGFYEFRDDEIVNTLQVDNSYKWAGGGFLSTPTDMVKFGFAHLQNKLFSPETKEIIWTSQATSDGKETRYGMGWFIAQDMYGNKIVQHGGGSVGGSSFLLIIPEENLVFAVAANSPAPFGQENAWSLSEPFFASKEIFSTASDPSVNTFSECNCVFTEGNKQDTIKINLIGNEENYDGRIYYGFDEYEIINAGYYGNNFYIKAILPSGYISNVLLYEFEEEKAAGKFNLSDIECEITR